MMKFLLLIAVIGLALFLFKSKARGRVDAARKPRADKGPQTMLACAHCGVHLPQADAVQGADGRVYCSDAHRLAGPR